MKTFLTSDLHVKHQKIVGPEGFESTRKHFKDADEFEDYIIKTHNSVVKEDDVVINLGDVAMNTTPLQTFEFLCKLNGQIILVKGNHDNSRALKYLISHNFEISKGRMKFIVHEMGFIMKHDGKIYHMTHYPMQMGSYRSKLRNFCGHIHNRVADSATSLNIGIDSPEVRTPGRVFGAPIELDEAAVMLENKVARFMAGFESNRVQRGQLSIDFETENFIEN